MRIECKARRQLTEEIGRRERERERVGSGKRERARVPGRRCVEGGVAGQSLGGTSRRSQPATVTEVPSGTVLLCSRVGPGGVRVRKPVSGAAVRRLGTVWGRLGPVGAGVPGASRFLASGVRGGTGQGGAPRWRRTRRDHAATGGRHQSPSQRTSTSGIGGRPGGVARLHWRAPELPGGFLAGAARALAAAVQATLVVVVLVLLLLQPLPVPFVTVPDEGRTLTIHGWTGNEVPCLPGLHAVPAAANTAYHALRTDQHQPDRSVREGAMGGRPCSAGSRSSIHAILARSTDSIDGWTTARISRICLPSPRWWRLGKGASVPVTFQRLPARITFFCLSVFF